MIEPPGSRVAVSEVSVNPEGLTFPLLLTTYRLNVTYYRLIMTIDNIAMPSSSFCISHRCNVALLG